MQFLRTRAVLTGPMWYQAEEGRKPKSPRMCSSFPEDSAPCLATGGKQGRWGAEWPWRAQLGGPEGLQRAVHRKGCRFFPTCCIGLCRSQPRSSL